MERSVTVPLKCIATALFWANEGRASMGEPWISALDIIPSEILAQEPWVGIHVYSLAEKHASSPNVPVSEEKLHLLGRAFADGVRQMEAGARPNTFSFELDLARAQQAAQDFQTWQKLDFPGFTA